MKYLKKIVFVISIVLASFNISGQSHGWTFDSGDYDFDGEIAAIVIHGTDEVTTGTLGAFVGETCRGFADATLFELTGKYVFSVRCWSNQASGEMMSFKYYDPSDGSYYDIKESVEFAANSVPNAISPFQFHTVPLIFAVTGGGSYCEGEPGLPVGLDGSETGVVYTLLKDGIPQTSTVDGTGVSITFGNQPGGTYTVSATNSGGTVKMTGNSVIIEDPLPAVPVADDGSDATCTGITANWNSSYAATSYALDVSTVNDFSSYVTGYEDLNVGNVTTLNITGLTEGTPYYYRVRGINSCGISASSGTINYSTSPSAPAAPGSISGKLVQCPALSGETYSITPVTDATTYTWTVPDGWSITEGAGTSAITVSTGITGQDGDITVTAGNSCGTSAASTLAVTLSDPMPLQPGVISGASVQCPGLEGQAYSIDGVLHATDYTWTVPDGWSVTAGAGTTSITVTTGASDQDGNISVAAANSCGVSPVSTLAIIVSPGTPSVPGPISGNSTQCPGLTDQIYSIIPVTDADTYTWSVPEGWSITEGEGTASIKVSTGTTGQNGIIYVTAGNSCGTSSSASLEVAVVNLSTAPAGIIITNNNTCSGTVKTLEVTGGSLGAGADWQWFTGSCGGTLAGTGSSIEADPAAGSNTIYYVRASGTCNTTSCASAIVIVTPNVGTPDIPVPSATTICQGSSATVYTTSASDALTYNWSVTGTDNSVSGTGTTGTVTWAPGFSGLATVSVTANGCGGISSPASTTVMVRPTPSASITGTTSVCQNSVSPDITFTNPMNLPVTITYNINEGENNIINVESDASATLPVSTSGSGIFVYKLVSVNYQTIPACPANLSQSATVTVNALPVPVLTCSDADNTFYEGAFITFTAGGGTLYDFMVDGASVQTGATNIYTTNTLTDGKIVSVKVTIGAGCNSVSTGITVHVITLPSGWAINPSAYLYNGKITAKVLIDDTAVESGFLAAFVGSECRGIVESEYVPASDHYVFDIICYSNSASGESLAFKYYDPLQDKTYNLNRTILYNAGMILGDDNAPIEMKNTVNYSKSFTTGWNWFSVNAILDNMTLASVLSNVNNDGDYIKNQVSSATYFTGYGWFGTLTAIDPTKLYKIKVQSNCSVNFAGVPVNVNSSPINIVSGWNWIGYMSQSAIAINDALSSLTLVELDYIKNQTKSATYYYGYGWFGLLANLSPGEGYMMRLANPGTLKYPDEPAKGDFGISTEQSHFSFDPADYEYNGSITASVYVDGELAGSENDILVAYINDQIRGVASGNYFDPAGTYLFPLMVHSNQSDGDTIEFRYYDAENDILYPCEETIIFRKDMIVTEAYNSFELNVNTTLENTTVPEVPEGIELKAYPNPFSSTLNIEYEISGPTHVTLEIFDIYGTKIRQLVNQVQQSDHYAIHWDSSTQSTGTYIIKIQAGDKQKIQKVTLIR